jgi:hypothetical protein
MKLVYRSPSLFMYPGLYLRLRKGGKWYCIWSDK